MDRITSNILGRPLGIHDVDIDAALPSEDSTEAFAQPMTVGSIVQRIAVFRKILDYRLFCGKLATALHRKRNIDTTMEDALHIRDDLADELETWYRGLHELRLPAIADGIQHRETSCFLLSKWYEVLYANASLMIWRPCPLLASVACDKRTLQRIHDSSTHAIMTYAALHRTRQINYTWVTLQSIFVAGLSYIYAVSRHIRHRRDATGCVLDKDPAPIDIVSVTRACSNALVAVNERWDSRRPTNEVINRLADAVLADAIKLQTTLSSESQLPPLAPQSRLLSSESGTRSQQMQMQSPNQIAYWNSMTSSGLTGAFDASPLAVDNEFLHCFDDIQSMNHLQQLEDPIMQLSHEWLGFLGDQPQSHLFSTGTYGQSAYYQSMSTQ